MTPQNPALSRRTFVKSSVAASGGLMLALSLPKANAGLDPWTGEPTGTEISAWLTIDPNSQVTIRVAQSEMVRHQTAKDDLGSQRHINPLTG